MKVSINKSIPFVNLRRENIWIILTQVLITRNKSYIDELTLVAT